MVARKGLRLRLLFGIVTLAVAGVFAANQATHSVASHGPVQHQLADGPPIWPPYQ